MSTAATYPHIECVPGQPPRLERVPRVRVAQIVTDYLAHGWSADEICRQYPHLHSAEVYASLGYYFDHQAEIDGEIRAEWAAADKERRDAAHSPFIQRLIARNLA